MASTVSANGLAVATSTSSHYAVTIADIRLVNRQVPTPLPNFIASEHIARGFPTTVRFDEGKVWNVPVEVGDPPKSNPVDTWPGAKSQAINSFASAAPGAGSPNVFVSGKKVLCFSHTTEQNARNSFGIITDKPGLDKLLKEYEDSLAKQKAKADADATSQSQGGGAGKGGQAAPPPTVPTPPPAEVKPAQGCAIAGVIATDGEKYKRYQKGRKAPDTNTLLEVIAGTGVDLVATPGTAMCGKHPIWSCAATGWSETGLTTTFKTPKNGVTSTGALSLITVFTKGPSVKATQYNVTLADCVGGEKYQRQIFSLPSSEVSVAELGFGNFGEFGNKIPFLIGKLGLDFVWEIKLMSGKLSFDGAWKAAEAGAKWSGQDYDYKCYYAASLTGSVTIFDAMARVEYSLLRPMPIPPIVPIQTAITALNAVTRAISGRDLIVLKVFIQIAGQLATKLGIEARKYYGDSFSLMPKATWDLNGSLTGSIGVRVAALESKAGNALASGTGSANLGLTASGGLMKNWPPGIAAKLTVNEPTLKLVLAYDLTVLIYSPDDEKKKQDERGGWSSFWSAVTSPVQTLKKGWSAISDSVRKQIADSLGENLKGSREYVLKDWGWKEKNFETQWRLPIG
jgi:hypothetical protein